MAIEESPEKTSGDGNVDGGIRVQLEDDETAAQDRAG